MKRTISTVFLAGALVALLLVAGAARIQAASTAISCSISPRAACQVNDSDGIQAIRVILETAQGAVLAVDNSYSCITSTTVEWDPVVPDFAIEVEDCAGQTEGAFSLAGLLHRALGDAQLRRDGAALVATGFDGDGDDGLTIETGEASYWAAWLLPAEPPTSGSFEALAFSADLMAPQATIQFSKYMTDVIVYPSPGFDGDPYQVQLFAGDSLVYEQSGIPSGDAEVGLAQWFCADSSSPLDCAPRLSFELDTHTGYNSWEISFPGETGMQTPGGRLEADRLRFTQQGSGPPPALRRPSVALNLPAAICLL